MAAFASRGGRTCSASIRAARRRRSQTANARSTSLNAAFPPTRAFAREILPGVARDAGDDRRRVPVDRRRRARCSARAELGGLAERARARPTRDLAKRHRRVARRCCRRPTSPSQCATRRRPADRRRRDPGRVHDRRARTTRSSGTRWSGSPARARTSTATARTCASRPAAARRRVSLGSRRRSAPASCSATTSRVPLGTRPALPGQAPAVQARRALLQADALPDLNGPAAAQAAPTGARPPRRARRHARALRERVHPFGTAEADGAMRTAIRKHLRDFVGDHRAARRRAAVVGGDPRPTSGSRCPAGCRSSARTSSSSRPSCRPPRRSRRARARRSTSPASRSARSPSVELEDGRRSSTMKIEPQVHADLQGRDRAAAAQDRPEGHGRRARRRARDARASCRRAARSRSPRRCPTSTSTRSSPSLDADTRDYLQLLLSDGGEGAATATAASSSTRSAASSRPRAYAAQDQRRARRAPARTSRASIHNFSLLVDELGDKDDAARDSSTTRTRSSRRFAAPGREPARDAAASCRRRCATTQTALGKVDALADELGPDARRRCGPAPARSARRCAQTRPFLRETTPVIRDEIRPFVRAALPDGARSCARRRATSRRRRPTSTTLVQGRSTRCSTTLAYNPPGKRRGLPVLARRGPTTSATRCSPRRTRTARSAAAWSSPPARRSQLLDSVAHGQPAARHADRPAQRAADAGRSARRSTQAPGRRRLMQKARPHPRPDRRDGRLRAVVLRAAAVPVARVRRPDPAQAEGLPLHTRRSPRRRSSRRRPTCGSPACRSARSRRSSPTSRPGRSDVEIELDAQLRAAAVGRAGDPAPEDAARRDLRRADAGHARARETVPEGGALPAGAGRRRRSSSTRSSARSTRRRARRSRSGCRRRRRRSTAAGATSTTRSATSAPFAEDTSDAASTSSTARRARCSGWSPTPASVFDALTERDGQLRGADRRTPTACSRRPRARDQRARRRRSSRCRRSSASRARRSTRLDAVRRRHRTRWSPSCARRRASCRPTLQDLGALAPDLKALFRDLDPLIDAVARRASRPPSSSSTSCAPLLAPARPAAAPAHPDPRLPRRSTSAS